ncbi:hypothetical protein [Emticicia sp. W12TSBA100-4]|uniref:hypothetical protein n=1 Tax=Emticicia sp. W12TSBA100-4 TaxID=3160965 RepID=UPI00330613A9
MTEKAKAFANLRHWKNDSLEIELPYEIKGRGSLHNFTFEKFKDSSANYIYLQNIKQKIASSELVLVSKKGYSFQRNLKGEIYINDSLININLKIPHYKNGVVKKWTNYQFNGKYIIKVHK